jgi:hypothetical protein
MLVLVEFSGIWDVDGYWNCDCTGTRDGSVNDKDYG